MFVENQFLNSTCFLHGRASTSMNAIQGMMQAREMSRYQTKDFSTVYHENAQCAIDMSYHTDSINHHTPNKENTTRLKVELTSIQISQHRYSNYDGFTAVSTWFIITSGEVSILPFISHQVSQVCFNKFEAAERPLSLVACHRQHHYHSQELGDVVQLESSSYLNGFICAICYQLVPVVFISPVIIQDF